MAKIALRMAQVVGLRQCEQAPCVFVLHRSVRTPGGPREDSLIVGCYVDDLYVLYNSSDKVSLYTQFTQALQERWSVEDEGEVADLLNVEITQVDGGVELRQTNYINKLLATWLPDGLPPRIQINSTPHTDELPSLALDAITAKDDCDPELKSRFQSLVGSLLYASVCTRPDVAYPVGILCRAMGSPTPSLFDAALRVLAYLGRHTTIGLRYEASSSTLAGMSDSHWEVRHSTSGYTFNMNKRTVSWASKKQPTIALSYMEAELVAATEAAKEAVYLDSFVKELGCTPIQSQPIHLSVDNKAAIDSSYNPENHSRSRHIERKHYFIRELVEMGRIVVPYVNSADNLADFFTKPLKPSRFFALRDRIMNVRRPSSK